MINILLTFLLFIVIAFLIMAPLFVFVFRKEVKEIFREYKNEQERISKKR